LDQWHAECAGAIERYADRCVTTEAVVTEACYFAGRHGGSGAIALHMLLDLAIPIVSIETGGMRRAAQLMDRYASVPMDFADSSLVAVAEALAVTTVLTIDRLGFAAYRTAPGAGFKVLP
jgi:predicted nucleic acid-binding protein